MINPCWIDRWSDFSILSGPAIVHPLSVLIIVNANAGREQDKHVFGANVRVRRVS
jgi:hypothetical protein